jgi:DNA polymerase IV
VAPVKAVAGRAVAGDHDGSGLGTAASYPPVQVMTARRRRIFHVDLDAFYVSVERRHDPRLAAVELLIVGGSPEGRGVVTSAAYPVRRFGVRSGMPSARARALCPEATFISPHFELYRSASREVMEVLRAEAPVVQPAGLDEAYLDLTGTESLYGDDDAAVAERIRRRIRARTGLAASIGCASNRLTAKMATNRAKPDGVYVVAAGGEAAFLADHEVGEVHGIGPATAGKLERLGIRTAGQLAARDPASLAASFGLRSARALVARARGEDDSEVTEPGPPKSIGKETTFAEDVHDTARLERRLRGLCEEAATRMRRRGMEARTITVKVRFADWDTVTRSETPAESVRGDAEVAQVAARLLEFLLERRRAPVRLVGVTLSGLADVGQPDLFGDGERQRHLSDAVDRLRDRFGPGIVRGGGSDPGGR